MQNYCLKVGRGILITMMVVGIIGFLSSLLCTAISFTGMRLISSILKFPLGNRGSLAIDNNSHLVYYSGDHHRMQIYDTDGNFIRGWFAYASNMTAEIDIDIDNHIKFVTDNDRYIIFDIHGKKISDDITKGIYEQYVKKNKSKVVKDSRGYVYYTCFTEPLARIIKVNPKGEKHTIITEPFYMWPFRGASSFFILCVIPVFLLGIDSVLKKRKGTVVV